MVTSKPLPPIPASSSTLTTTATSPTDEPSSIPTITLAPSSSSHERRSLFSTIASLKRRSEAGPSPPANATATNANSRAMAHDLTTTSASHGTPSTSLVNASTTSVLSPTAGAVLLKNSPLRPHLQPVPLDQRSLLHIRAIARQSIASSCLEPEILWQRLLMDMIQKLASNVSDAWQQIETAYRTRLEATTTVAETQGHPSSLVAPEVTSTLKKPRKREAKPSETPPREAEENWPHYSYNLRLVKHVSTSQECSFTAGRFEGDSVLAEESFTPDEAASLKDAIQLGGTISISAGAENLPKAVKILELLIFALCSLQLETYLMRDHGVVKPEPSLTIPTTDMDTKHPPSSQASSINSKRSSKGSMFFGWLSRGTGPAKYKKGTTQLASDLESKPGYGRRPNGSENSNTSQHTIEGPASTEDLNNNNPAHFQRFAKIIQQIEKSVISVSPDIVFPPPHLLVRLRNEENLGHNMRRKSYNWEDIELVTKKIGFGNRIGRCKSTVAGIGNNQRFGSITSDAVSLALRPSRLPIDSRAGLEHLMTNSDSLQGIYNHQSLTVSYSRYWSATAATPCSPPKMITLEYYRKTGGQEDMSLGEMLQHLCKRVDSDCAEKTCHHKRLGHISSYTHGEGRVNITVERPELGSATDLTSGEFAPFLETPGMIAAWTRCKMCRAKTKAKALSSASMLYSFGKYLELLLYANHFEPGSRPLCEHVRNKDSIVRCFLNHGLVATFEHETIDLFEMRLSRHQVQESFPLMPQFGQDDLGDDVHELAIAHPISEVSRRPSTVSTSSNCDYITESDQSSQLNKARLEILRFYESCKKIIVTMEEYLGERKSVSKNYSYQNKKETAATPTTTAAATVVDPAKKVALDQLEELGDRWRIEEFEFYDQLKQTPIYRLNDLRNRIRECVRRTVRSMEAWQKDHCPKALESESDKLANKWVLPDYVQSETLHTFPGSSVIVREDEPSSIIAAALSQVDYLRMLSSMYHHGESQEKEDEVDIPPALPKKDFQLSSDMFTAPTPTPLRTSRSAGSATLAPRKSGSEGSEGSTAVTSTANGSTTNDDSRSQGGAEQDGGDEEDDEDEDGEDSFLVIDGYQTNVRYVKAAKDFSSLIPSGARTPRGTLSLHFGGTSRHSRFLSPPDKRPEGNHGRPVSMMHFPNSTPSLVTSPESTFSEATPTSSSAFLSPVEHRATTPTPSSTGAKSKNTFGYHSFASGISGTMKGLSLNTLSEKLGSGFSTYGSTSASAHMEKSGPDYFRWHGDEKGLDALALEAELATRSPHLKARFSHGTTTFSCTIYFAEEFDKLRRQCGIHATYVESLSRCTTWNASGGKSKSSFYKTQDDRFVVKEMVSSWNIAEKDELLKFAPKYFEYMEKTHRAPTVLAKIFGFYTFKIKNGATGFVKKIDVLVMEHLFYNQKVTTRFDLKGIQDRHVASSKSAAATGGSPTLWDGDFIEGRYKALLLIHSHSKKIIRESLQNDTDFLASANIMDYSLLIGVDDERKELVVGIVDFIGAYTWYKRIESKGKTTLRASKDSVTVLPPQQYKTRFKEAMERYFLAVPDKWTKTALEQGEEANKEAALYASSEVSKEGPPTTTDTDARAVDKKGSPHPEGNQPTKSQGYFEKVSKAILASMPTDMLSAYTGDYRARSQEDVTEKQEEAEGEFEEASRLRKLPHVFYPLA